jgi:predicted acyl esterase
VEFIDADFEPRYEQSSTDAIYLTMQDGVRIAVDVTLPSPLPTNARIPTIVAMTRYWRAEQGEETDWRIRAAANRGYAFVFVDERGTGASFGVWPHPWSQQSLADFHEVVVQRASWILGNLVSGHDCAVSPDHGAPGRSCGNTHFHAV